MPLEITVTAGERGPVMVLAGETDLATTPELCRELTALLATGARHMTVDVSALTFADTKGGWMGIRIADAMRVDRKKGGKITDSKGRENQAGCWGMVADWCDYSGPVEGKTAGITLFADPSSPSPSCWHARGYGLLAANRFGRAHSGFPAMAGNVPFLMKDVVLLAVSFYLLKQDAVRAYRAAAERRDQREVGAQAAAQMAVR